MDTDFIDLYSDTQTRPSPEMREAMARAVVGDDQRGEDPTCNELCERIAELLGKERALFMPSGTMCNEVAIAVHCTAGTEIICDRTAHIITAETGGPSGITGAMVRGLNGHRGQFTADQVRNALRRGSQYEPRSRLLVVEQTSNHGGGSIWPVQQIDEVAAVAHENGLATHMDGARLMNAAVETGIYAKTMAGAMDTVWLDFTKALGAPLGAVLAGPVDFIAEAIRWRQMLGGGLRQAGICAAACIYALENNVERLAEDHDMARALAYRITAIDGLSVDPAMVETNIVFFDLTLENVTPQEIIEELKARGVRIGTMGGPKRFRAIPHLDVTMEDVHRAADILAEVIATHR